MGGSLLFWCLCLVVADGARSPRLCRVSSAPRTVHEHKDADTRWSSRPAVTRGWPVTRPTKGTARQGTAGHAQAHQDAAHAAHRWYALGPVTHAQDRPTRSGGAFV